MGGYDATPWGQACALLHAELLADYPELKLGIGPDAKSLYKAPQAITFGYQPRGAPTASPTMSGARRRNPFDDMVNVAVEIWMADAEEAYACWLRFLVAVNKILHGRRGTPGAWRAAGGQIGDLGAKIISSLTIRVPAYAAEAAAVKPTSQEPRASTVNPAGGQEEGAALAAS